RLRLVGGEDAVRLGEQLGGPRKDFLERAFDLRRHEKRGGIRASGEIRRDWTGHREGAKYNAGRVLNSARMPTAVETSACTRCNGSGWIPVPGDALRVEPCGCQGDLRRRQRLASASIPKRY